MYTLLQRWDGFQILLAVTLGRLLLFFVVLVAVRSAVLEEGSKKQFDASDNLVSSLIV